MGNAIGFVETRGLTAAIEAADAMVKAANVRIIEYRVVGSGLVNITVQGDVAAVKAAVDAGVAAAQKVGEIVSFNVIPRPHEEMLKVIPVI
ncbi:BMC domain-containing protein [Carboxydothermus hydrogenoformans]|uniref:Propanediol utilization protein PduA n=1 Tax=Carboxydothermus hydrogenoformans (strain ATCC BAA-161 / DSM 6008 / Z-2901) TaxID=246194 RepID=Q3AE97_CARHZ|nr:BMC domain-containing protein [Carboxydothermus hydrogenoformans]ABB15329.1 propanediol utilization protein PduA [Carboxydothermus hydrogenoformans Z-2901]